MRMGRPAVFRDKVKDVAHRVVGFLSVEGRAAFERERKRLGMLYQEIMGREISVSDADTIEYLARGASKTRTYLNAQRRTEAAEK